LRHEGLAKADGNTLENDLIATFFDPVRQRRFESKTVRAAVPEKFKYLDFFTCLGRLGLGQALEFDPFDRIGR
jgi:hypothetical protein